MSEPIRVNDVTEEMKQFNAAMETLGGFISMIQPVGHRDVSISRCRFYTKIFEAAMVQIDAERQIIYDLAGANDRVQKRETP